MSRKLVSKIYEHKVGSMLRKAVLTAMADRANDDGTGVWTSKQRIATEIEASRQGVVNAIKGLVADGLLIEVGERGCANGWTMEYTINVDAVAALPVRAQDAEDPSSFVGVQKTNTPPNPVEATPTPGVGHPPTPFTQTVLNRPEPTVAKATVERASAPPATIPPEPQKRSGKARGAARGTRIPSNWTPTPKDYAFASSEGLTREEINREADRFRDYWAAAAGRNACKLDWEATWRNWLRSDFRKPSRAPVAKTANAAGGAFDRVVGRLDEGAQGQPAPGRSNLSAFDAAAIDGEFTVISAGDASGSDWSGGRGGQADAGSLFAKRRA